MYPDRSVGRRPADGSNLHPERQHGTGRDHMGPQRRRHPDDAALRHDRYHQKTRAVLILIINRVAG